MHKLNSIPINSTFHQRLILAKHNGNKYPSGTNRNTLRIKLEIVPLTQCIRLTASNKPPASYPAAIVSKI